MDEEPRDIQSQREPEVPTDPEVPVDPGAGFPWGGLAILVGIVLIVVFAVQNTEIATIDFLWLSGDFPLAIVILATAVVAALFSVSAGALYRRRRRRRRVERQELRQRRSES